MAKNAYIGVNGVARKVKKGYIGVDGVARKVKNGFIGVNNVARQFFSGGTPLSALAVGTIVKLNENGVAQEYIIVNQGIPSGSSLYDASCNGTWLLRKNIYNNRAWHSPSANNYRNSNIHTYLNGTFLSVFDSSIQNTTKQAIIPCYEYGGGSYATTGADGLSTKIFLLSIYEIGGFNRNLPGYCGKDGATISYFSECTNNDANSKRIATLNGTASIWWLRSPFYTNSSPSLSAVCVKTDGSSAHGSNTTIECGIRPALIMPFDITVDENMNIIAA